MFFKKLVISGSVFAYSLLVLKSFLKLSLAEGVVPMFVALLGANNSDLSEESALALAAVASYDATARDFVLVRQSSIACANNRHLLFDLLCSRKTRCRRCWR